MTPFMVPALLLFFTMAPLKGATAKECIPKLPVLKDQGFYSPMLLIGIQAIVPAYRISCNGTLTHWKVATVREGQHNIHLQVWRPGHEEDSYDIAGENIFNIKPQASQRLFSLTPDNKDLINVQTGDIIGFYLENNKSISNDFSIQYQPNTGEVSVLYRQLSAPIRKVAHNTLPVELLNAAPIILAEINTLATEGGTTDHTATNPTFRSTPAAEPDDPHTNLEVPCPTKETDLSLIMSSILAAVLGATCLLLALVIALIITCRRGASRKGSMKLREEIYDDYECRRAVVIPPTFVDEHTDEMPLAVPLRANPIYERIPESLAHEYETPVVQIGYDVPRGSHDYENI